MWFASEVQDAWEFGIKAAVTTCGYHPVRIDEVHHHEKIDDRILRAIRESDFVIADLTGCPDIIIPDGFSPNNDGINDTFVINNLPELYPNFKLEIYNRYGNLVYQGNINTPNWDGTTNVGGLNLGNNLLPVGEIGRAHV